MTTGYGVCRLYTEMDFRNEAANAQRMQLLLSQSEHGRSASVFIPQPVLEHTTRRVWICCFSATLDYSAVAVTQSNVRMVTPQVLGRA